ncbi:MAG: hypothetical protein ABI469_03220 [Gemmatimonadales bacterium]
MVLSALRPDASLSEYLTERARAASVTRLTADALAGALAFAAAVWWELPLRLVFASIVACLFCYGAWGLLDRARTRAAARHLPKVVKVLDILCLLSAALGTLAVAGVLLAVWALALGTWIS